MDLRLGVCTQLRANPEFWGQSSSVVGAFWFREALSVSVSGASGISVRAGCDEGLRFGMFLLGLRMVWGLRYLNRVRYTESSQRL